MERPGELAKAATTLAIVAVLGTLLMVAAERAPQGRGFPVGAHVPRGGVAATQETGTAVHGGRPVTAVPGEEGVRGQERTKSEEKRFNAEETEYAQSEQRKTKREDRKEPKPGRAWWNKTERQRAETTRAKQGGRPWA